MPGIGTNPDSVQGLDFFLSKLISGLENQIRVWTGSEQNSDFIFAIEKIEKSNLKIRKIENSKFRNFEFFNSFIFSIFKYFNFFKFLIFFEFCPDQVQTEVWYDSLTTRQKSGHKKSRLWDNVSRSGDSQILLSLIPRLSFLKRTL